MVKLRLYHIRSPNDERKRSPHRRVPRSRPYLTRTRRKVYADGRGRPLEQLNMSTNQERFSQRLLGFAREYWIALPILASFTVVGIAMWVFLPRTANYAEAVSRYKE